jgi:hypothetical protein
MKWALVDMTGNWFSDRKFVHAKFSSSVNMHMMVLEAESTLRADSPIFDKSHDFDKRIDGAFLVLKVSILSNRAILR